MVSERQPQLETSTYQPTYEYTGATFLDQETDVAFNLANERLLPLEEARRMAASAPTERPKTKEQLQLEVIQSVNRNIAAMRRDRLDLAA